MAVRIRMKRMGRRHRPFFRISVMDARSPRDGKSIEDIGYYDPMVRNKAERVRLDMERLEYWLSVGAQPTEKVATLIKKVKTNKFGVAKEPPPAASPKAPEEATDAAPAEDAAAEATGQADADEQSGSETSA